VAGKRKEESFVMTDAELRVLIADLAKAQAETDRQLKETDRELREMAKGMDQYLKELGKQIGGINNKFGSMTEAFALPSMERILQEKFGMDVVHPCARSTVHGEHIQLDMLAYENGGGNRLFIVEVKSHIRPESLDQILRELREFPKFFSSLADKKRFGILCGIEIDSGMRKKIAEAGIYLAVIRDDQFIMENPPDFKPRAF